ncbi:MAG: hypothetical protein RI996_565 [Candidatus Parcubacteria bacterium]|jgi:hypothetical protein
MKWILNKITINGQLIVAVILSLMFLVLYNLGTNYSLYELFLAKCWDVCRTTTLHLLSVSILGPAIFLQSILLYFKKSTQLFNFWKKILIPYLIIYLIIYLIVPLQDNSLFLSLEKAPVLLGFSILFIVISLPLLLYKSFKK